MNMALKINLKKKFKTKRERKKKIKKEINKEQILSYIVKKRNKIAALCICLILLAGCAGYSNWLNGSDEVQYAAARWQAGKQAFAQVSVFLSLQEKFTENDRNGVISKIRMAFQENSIKNENEKGGEEGLWKDCYSCEGKLTFAHGNSSIEARVTATGGDFFFFHPGQWLSGYAYGADDIMADRVVLDKELAWNLFGSAQVEGMPLTINGNNYYVAGVLDISKDGADQAAYGEDHRAWMPYRAFCKEYGGSSAGSSGGISEKGNPIGETQNTGDTGDDGNTQIVSEKPPITCYEIILPNPVQEWANNIIKEAFSAEGRSLTIIENSSRMKLPQVFNGVKNFTKIGMVTEPVCYPYWENAARIRDARRQICLVVSVAACIYPLICFFQGIRWLYRKFWETVAKIKKKF